MLRVSIKHKASGKILYHWEKSNTKNAESKPIVDGDPAFSYEKIKKQFSDWMDAMKPGKEPLLVKVNATAVAGDTACYTRDSYKVQYDFQK